MARIKIDGLDKWVRQLDNLSAQSEVIVGKAIYKGSKVVADATKTALENLETDDRTKVETRKSINTLQKKALISSFGIAPLRNDRNFLNVKTGFDGYNSIVTPRWPLGQPNVMIARSLESGTSFMKKNPIISKATKNSKNKCIEEMQKSLEEEINKLTR